MSVGEFIAGLVGTFVLLCFALMAAALPLTLVFMLGMLMLDIWKTRER